MNHDIHFNVKPLQRTFVFICITALCYIIAGIVSAVIMNKGLTGTRVCLATVAQDIIVFILPALATSMIITRRPADFLSIRQTPKFVEIFLACLCLVIAIPFMNLVISWNANIELPGGIGEWMHTMEDSAAKTIATMVNGQSVLSLIVLILVVGVFAGFSEELFFRGCLQRLMITSRINPHVAIWTTAIIFSAIHLQFFGFVPRMLLGALFGYLAWSSGSVWTAIAAHVFNNILAAVTMWEKSRNASSEIVKLENLGSDDIVIALTSLALAAICLIIACFVSRRKNWKRSLRSY